ncbi:MAG: hypothetical protein LC624_12730 [Halobacteriales archaeon]|nr:hypothetical protein [Halobacteriales archaeon]
MSAPTVAKSSIDRSFYAVLKLHVFATVHDVFLRSFSGRNGHAVQDAKPTLGRFTARKADYLFVPRNGNALKCSADFFGFTSHKVREKLTQLEAEGVVSLEGRGLRDAYTYRWTAPLSLPELCSFMVLWRHTQHDLSVNIELARVFDAAGGNVFTFADFARAYAQAHGEEYNASRWGARKYESLRSSSEYDRFLRARLQKLVDQGLVLTDGKAFRLADKARELVHHFHLFVDSVPYHPSRALCASCPLFDNCRTRGLVEPMLGQLSRHLETFPLSLEGNGANGNGHHANVHHANGHAGNGANGNGGNGHGPA